VVQSAENWRRDNTMAVANSMAARRHEVISRSIRNAWSQTRVWPASVVVHDPLPKDGSQVALVQRDHPVQTLAPDRTDHAFAERIRLRRAKTNRNLLSQPIRR
jgi:hypothetical protein